MPSVTRGRDMTASKRSSCPIITLLSPTVVRRACCATRKWNLRLPRYRICCRSMRSATPASGCRRVPLVSRDQNPSRSLAARRRRVPGRVAGPPDRLDFSLPRSGCRRRWATAGRPKHVRPSTTDHVEPGPRHPVGRCRPSDKQLARSRCQHRAGGRRRPGHLRRRLEQSSRGAERLRTATHPRTTKIVLRSADTSEGGRAHVTPRQDDDFSDWLYGYPPRDVVVGGSDQHRPSGHDVPR